MVHLKDVSMTYRSSGAHAANGLSLDIDWMISAGNTITTIK